MFKFLYILHKYILGFKCGFDMSDKEYRLLDEQYGLCCYECGRLYNYYEYPRFFQGETYCKNCGYSMASANNLDKWCKWKDKELLEGQKDE